MKVLILSDTHHGTSNMNKLFNFIEREIDVIVHAGDNFIDSVYLSNNTGKPVLAVAGNCDFDDVEQEIVFELEGIKFFLTHGHRYGVKYGFSALAEKAKQEGADIAIFGHTHIKEDSILNGVKIINPGSLSQPRDGFEKSFVVMDIDNKKEKHKFMFI